MWRERAEEKNLSAHRIIKVACAAMERGVYLMAWFSHPIVIYIRDD